MQNFNTLFRYNKAYNEFRDYYEEKEACKNSGFNVDEQLVDLNKLSKRNN